MKENPYTACVESASTSSLSSTDSYVFVSLPVENEGDSNEINDRLQVSATNSSSKYSKHMSMDPLLESGRYVGSGSGKVTKGRRRSNICRTWNSLSRFQRSLLSGVGVLFLCSSIFIFSTYYLTSRLRPGTSGEAHFGKLQDEDKSARTRSIEKTRANLPEKGPGAKINFKGPQNERQKAIAGAFKHAWAGYKKYAWGHDHLKPVSRAHHDWFGLGLTLIDSLDTMLIMGLETEFAEAKEWIASNLTFDVNKYVNLFETTIRVLGGLLSTYHLSGDRMFLEKARILGDRLTGAFSTASKIPYSDVNLLTRKAKAPSWGADSSLSEVSSIQLEFRDLSRHTGNPLYEQFAFNVSLQIHRIGCDKYDGLCPMFISPKTGRWQGGEAITMGARADSYYEYLFKQWLQTGKSIDWLREDYLKSMQGMVKHLVRQSEPNKMSFVGEVLADGGYSPKMDHLVCFIAGILALGAKNGMPQDHMDLAKQLAHTCHEMYRNPSGLGPEIAYFNMLPGTTNQDDLIVKPLDAHSLLRPEAIEAYFYLYRLTGDKRYQDWGWEAFEAIEKHARIPTGGYASVHSVKKVPVTHKDMMESFFLGETLKYLYLLMDDDQQTLLPLDKFIFNTEAHLLPILER